MEQPHQNSTLKVCALSVLMSLAIFTLPAQAEKQEVPAGTTFKLFNGVRATLVRVDVKDDAAANGIDVTVVLNRDDAGNIDNKEAMIEQAEFCLRYSGPVLAQSMGMSQYTKVKKLSAVYVGANPAIVPFTFPIAHGRCVLDAPFPADLIATAVEQSNEELD